MAVQATAPALEQMGHSGDNGRMTTILTVRNKGKVAIGGDGQVTLGNSVMKADANKIRKLKDGNVLCGFAGSSARARCSRGTTWSVAWAP